MGKKLSFSTLHKNRQDILWHPEQYKQIVTHFSAGGFGACAYRANITIAELVRCWQHEEYQTKCPYCGEMAYITQWAGKVNDGCFWVIRSFCPHCGKEHHASMCGYKNVKGENIHYRRMMDVAKGVRKELENNKYANYLSIPEAFKRDNWECSHKFVAGNCWKKGDDEVTCFLGKYRFNGKEVDKDFIHRMLNIDKRYLEMCEFLGSEQQLHSEYGRTFFEGVKWADSTPLKLFYKESTQSLYFAIVSEAFEKEGWEKHLGIVGYNRWTKGGLEVKSVQGEYKMDEKILDAAQLCELLHIDRRTLQVCKAIEPYPIHAKYGQTFLAGVRWADEHPIGQKV